MRKNCLSHPVEFVDGAFAEDNPKLAETLKAVAGSESPRVLLVSDYNVVQRTAGLGSRIGKYFQAYGIAMAGPAVVLSGGEKIKTDALRSVSATIGAAVTCGLTAKDVVLALGGGATLDVAGYAAAQLRGGIRVVRMPTTPQAMFGSAYATTAMVNSAECKGMLRLASAPAAVVVDCAFAATVLDGVWRAGYAEALRLALAADAKWFEKLARRAADYGKKDAAALRATAEECLAFRQKHGDCDFALWLSSRMEELSGYKLPYGYAVALAVLAETAYAKVRGRVDDDALAAVKTALTECGAMEGAAHSLHLFGNPEAILAGCDRWLAFTNASAPCGLAAVGMLGEPESPDPEAMKQALALLK